MDLHTLIVFVLLLTVEFLKAAVVVAGQSDIDY